MNIREISDVFKDTASGMTAIKSYNFGWASDRVRQGNTEDYQELNEFPRIFFSVPTIVGSDQTRKQDTYQVTLFFDDLLGYDNEGDADLTLQIDKWASLQQYANYFIQRLNLIKQTILPNYLFIPEAPSITFDSFTGIQRMVTVQLTFNLVVPTNCDIALTKLVECIANITTSTQLEASLTTVLKFAANFEARATLTADINFVQKAQASLTGAGTTAADLTVASAFDADAQAFFDRVTTAGGTLTTTEKNAVNTLVVQMKADGIWTKMKAIYPMVGASAAACAQNLKSASFTGTFSSGWTFASTGVTPNGTSAFMDTGLKSNLELSLNSAHISIYSRTNIDGLFCDFGATNGNSSDTSIFSKYLNFLYPRIHNINNGIANSISSQGLFISNRITSSEIRAFQNNNLKTIANNSNQQPTINFTLAKLNSDVNAFFSSRQYAFASIGDGLTDTEAANFYTAVQAFQTSLSRQV